MEEYDLPAERNWKGWGHALRKSTRIAKAKEMLQEDKEYAKSLPDSSLKDLLLAQLKAAEEQGLSDDILEKWYIANEEKYERKKKNGNAIPKGSMYDRQITIGNFLGLTPDKLNNNNNKQEFVNTKLDPYGRPSVAIPYLERFEPNSPEYAQGKALFDQWEQELVQQEKDREYETLLKNFAKQGKSNIDTSPVHIRFFV